MTENHLVLAAGQISKRFGAVQALDAVDFELRAGEIHGLIGENGAGKSTLMKILAGVYPPDGGSLRLDGKPIRPRDPKQAYDLGIRIVHQELSLVPPLTVAENLFLHEFASGDLGRVDRKALASRARDLLDAWDLEIEPADRIERLAMGKRQLVEIARELHKQGRILILDEPTSSLTSREIDHLFDVLRGLKEKRVSVVFISHRLNEVLQIADTVTILRNGKRVESCPAARLSMERITALMLGRRMDHLFPELASTCGETILSVAELSGPGFARVSFELRAGEIQGIGGLMGAGRSELLRSLFGLHPIHHGTLKVEGKPVKIRNPKAAVKLGLALLSESRLDEGIFPDLSVSKNLVLMKLEEVAPKGWLRTDLIRQKVSGLVERLKIATYDAVRQNLNELSGGNQQKVVLGRLMGSDPRVLLLDEPTRGVDLGTKAEIHQIMADLAAQGKAILMVSSDVSELVGMCDRILVLHQGREVAHFERGQVGEQEVVRCSMGDRPT